MCRANGSTKSSVSLQQRKPLGVPLAAAGVLLLVLVVLGSVLLIRRPDPAPSATSAPPTAEPASASAPATPAPRPPATASALAPTAAPTPVPTLALPAATAEPTAAVAVLVTGTSQVVATLPAEWWNDVRPVEPALASVLERAFNRFWAVRIQASYDLNPEPLPEVMAGVALEREINALNGMRARNQAARMTIEHSVQLLHAGPDEAAIEDDYTLNMVYVDAQTKDPVQPTPVGSWQYAYRMRNMDGTWKVVDSVRLVDG